MYPDDKPTIDDQRPAPPRQAMEQAPLVRVRLSERTIEFDGYAHGIHQPAAQYRVSIDDHDPGRLELLDGLIPGGAHAPPPEPGWAVTSGVVRRLLDWTTALLRQGAHPVFEPARVLTQSGTAPSTAIILQPCLNPRATLQVVRSLIELINLALDEAVGPERLSSAATQSLAELDKRLKRTGLAGFNTIHLLTAAFELGVPWRQLYGTVFQLGHGARSRWLDSSWTDRTATVGTHLARNKVATSRVLRLHGLPVPPHAPVDSAEEAVMTAESLGYPVVVKPVDLDGGVGVKAGLGSADAVRAAFEEAVALSPRVLVEKHVPGRDYRLLVVDGQVLGLLERVPGGVVGNGIDSVKILLEKQNLERQTATDDRRHLHTMAFDEEARLLLAAVGKHGDSVPAPGEVVRLRSASNVASGGIPVPLSLEQADPDNLRLAVRAASALRLDVAGIDLLIEDIGRSWLQTGANICEVNSKPQMFTTQHKPLLVHMMKGGSGRIPVAIVVEPPRSGQEVALHIHRQLLGAGTMAGLARGSQAIVGPDVVSQAGPDVLSAANMLLLDVAVQALVIGVTDEDALVGGWPVDRCDVLVLCAGAADAASPTSTGLNWIARARHLQPTTVLVDASDERCVRQARATFAGQGVVMPVPYGTAEHRLAVADHARAALLGSAPLTVQGR